MVQTRINSTKWLLFHNQRKNLIKKHKINLHKEETLSLSMRFNIRVIKNKIREIFSPKKKRRNSKMYS
jgi:hypothetical protein